MYFKPLKAASIAAILSTTSAAPAISPDTGHLYIRDAVAVAVPYLEFRRSAAAAPAVTGPKLPTITACHIPELGGPSNCTDGGGYLKRSVDDDEDSIVIGSKKRSLQGYHDTFYTEERRSIASKKRSPQPKLATIDDENTKYGVDEEWPVDNEDYEKRSLIHDPLPTGDDEGYLRCVKTKRTPMWKEGTCGPEEDFACYPDGSNGKRSPEEPAEDVGAYDEEDGVPFKRSPMWDEKTCGPEEDLACYPDGSNGKRSPPDEIQPQPLPPGAASNEYVKRSPAAMRPIDGDYPVPNDDSYPVRRDPRPPLDFGGYAPPNDDGFYDLVEREPEPPLDAGDYGGVGLDGFYLDKAK